MHYSFLMHFILPQCGWSLYVHQKSAHTGRPHGCIFTGVCGRFGVGLSLDHERMTVLQESPFFPVIVRDVNFLNFCLNFLFLKWVIFLICVIHPLFSVYTINLALAVEGLPWWLSWWRIHLQCGRPEFNPWAGKVSWRREWLPLQFSGQENSMDCIVHGVTKSWTGLSDFHFHLA